MRHSILPNVCDGRILAGISSLKYNRSAPPCSERSNLNGDEKLGITNWDVGNVLSILVSEISKMSILP